MVGDKDETKRNILFKAKISLGFWLNIARCNLDEILLSITTTEYIMHAFN